MQLNVLAIYNSDVYIGETGSSVSIVTVYEPNDRDLITDMGRGFSSGWPVRPDRPWGPSSLPTAQWVPGSFPGVYARLGPADDQSPLSSA